MAAGTSHYFSPQPEEGRRLHYLEWGDADNSRVLLCMHGLTRTAQDFQPIAEVLSSHYRVLSMDFAGRGKSDWLEDPMGYDYQRYLADVLALLEHLDLAQVDWLGTSMGGILGMLVAAHFPDRIGRLVLNDIGAFIPQSALERIQLSLERPHEYPDLQSVERLLRRVHAPFGPLSDEQWAFLASISSVAMESGAYRLHYDPAIAVPFNAQPLADVDLSDVWRQCQLPVLILQGAESDLLPDAVVRQMLDENPQANHEVIAGVGHAPALMDRDQIMLVSDWLLTR